MSRKSILLIDPFKNLLDTYQMILVEEGFLVETASNLEDAALLHKARRYGVIITEYFPPAGNTGGFIQSVKQETPETYAIILTHLTINGSIYEKLYDFGVDDLISKPYSPKKILVHIKKGLRQGDMILRKRELETQSLLDPVGQKIHQFIFKPVFFKKCFRQELKKAKRYQEPFSLLLLQIPAKESVGDRFEDFYSELATIIRKYVREEDIVGRENGHFGILLPRTDQIGCEALVQRLLSLLRNHPTFQSDQVLKPIVQTISLRSFTYPEQFVIPDSLKAVLEEVNEEYRLMNPSRFGTRT